jgi:hypothetical protein
VFAGVRPSFATQIPLEEERAVKCEIDQDRLMPIRNCMTNFLDPAPALRPWENASVANDAVARTCGAIGRLGESVDHDHDPGEWQLCRELAGEAVRLMDGVEAIGSGFSPFFMVVDRGSERPGPIDEATIRADFGGTLYPGLQIVVEPLAERGDWWTEVREYLVDNDDAEADDEDMADGLEELEKWRALIRWFGGQGEIQAASMVRMKGTRRPWRDWTCCNFPFLVIGRTRPGSLVGIWSTVVDSCPASGV